MDIRVSRKTRVPKTLPRIGDFEFSIYGPKCLKLPHFGRKE